LEGWLKKGHYRTKRRTTQSEDTNRRRNNVKVTNYLKQLQLLFFQASWQIGYRVKENAKSNGKKKGKSPTTTIIDFN
jgi:hypothetical protein